MPQVLASRACAFILLPPPQASGLALGTLSIAVCGLGGPAAGPSSTASAHLHVQPSLVDCESPGVPKQPSLSPSPHQQGGGIVTNLCSRKVLALKQI